MQALTYIEYSIVLGSLVIGSLIAMPSYIHWQYKRFTGIETSGVFDWLWVGIALALLIGGLSISFGVGILMGVLIAVQILIIRLILPYFVLGYQYDQIADSGSGSQSSEETPRPETTFSARGPASDTGSATPKQDSATSSDAASTLAQTITGSPADNKALSTVNDAVSTGDEHRKTARTHREAGEYGRALMASENARTAYNDALDTATENILIDTDPIEAKLSELDDEQHETRRQQLRDEVTALRSTLNRAEALAAEDDLDEAQSVLETLSDDIRDVKHRASQHNFGDLQEEITTLERQRENRLEVVIEQLQARPIPETIPRAPSLSVDYDALTDRESIGAGGNADVTKATLSTPDGDVTLAIKEPRMNETMHTDAVERLLDEAETWQRLDDHDHIVGVIDYDAEPLPWIAMEYMDAGHLGDRVGEMAFDQALWTAIATTKAVRHAHRRGIAHLDLKPANVLFRSVEDAWDVPKVADWGLSKHLLNHSKSVEGMSVEYAAPEQFDEDRGPADDITDVYQLGAVFYELFTGQPPFEGQPFQVMKKVETEEPTPPSDLVDVPPELDEILLTALAKEKDDRYESVLLLRNDLQALFE
jgi:tRNA A-37 threonylcarbamoyl transferase component Bud32